MKYIAYNIHTWVPDESPVTPGCTLFDPFMTNQFEHEDDDTNNNTSESYNSRLRSRLGDHPNFHKFTSG
jgi:hypothetical protein